MVKDALLCFFILALGVLCARELTLLPDGKLHAYVLDVGQGDSIFLVTPDGHQILIDGGPDLSTLSYLSRLMPFFDRSIDLVVLTHADADHITALPSVLRRYHVDQVLLSGRLHASGRIDALLAALKHSDTKITLAHPDKDITFGDVTLDIVWPSPQAVADARFSGNNLSVVLRALYKDHSILLTGDIEAEAERAIVASQVDIRSEILKVAHHGSKTSTTSVFLQAASPQLALISVAEENRYGHPHASVLSRLSAMGIPIKTTAQQGVISMVFE